MEGELLDSVDQTPIPAHDRLEEEPNLDLLISIRRSPQGGSTYRVSVLREGEAQTLTLPQKQFGAAVLHHVASLLDQTYIDAKNKNGWELTIDAAKLAARLVILNQADLISYLHAAVESQGVENTARMMRWDPAEIEFYLTFQSYHPRQDTFQMPSLFPLEHLERWQTIERRLSARRPGAWESRSLKGPKKKLAMKAGSSPASQPFRVKSRRKVKLEISGNRAVS